MASSKNADRQSRGAFILFEGCDATGKTTQAVLLQRHLQSLNIPSRMLKFPDRETYSGNMLDNYLVNNIELSDESVHLLFAANRWEMHKEIEELLTSGVTLIVDRYSFSGIAYGIAKGLDTVWCFTPELGLIQPDLVFYMQVKDIEGIHAISIRNRCNLERYDQIQFQRKVANVFDLIYQTNKHYWKALNALASVGQLHISIIHNSLEIIDDVKHLPLSYIQSNQILDITTTMDNSDEDNKDNILSTAAATSSPTKTSVSSAKASES